MIKKQQHHDHGNYLKIDEKIYDDAAAFSAPAALAQSNPPVHLLEALELARPRRDQP